MLLGRSTGGIGTHVADLSTQLRVLGAQVQVVTDSGTASRFGLTQARPWWPLPGRGLGRNIADVLRLRRLLAGADVVHAHGHQAGVLAVLVCAAMGAPPAVVVSRHNAVPRGRGLGGVVREAAQRLAARRATLLTGASSDLVEEARRHGARWAELAPVPSPRVARLLGAPPLGDGEREHLASALLRQTGLTGAGPLVVTVSRIAAQKDLGTLIDAAALLPTPATWVVVGDGDVRLLGQLRGRAEQAGVPVHFIGGASDPGPWLRAAEVFALTSTWEARALVVQEAMAAGTPVVCSDAGGLSDLVEGAGRLVPVGDPQGFARAVGEVLADPAVRHTGSLAGRARAATWPDSEVTARRWLDWYSQSLAMT